MSPAVFCFENFIYSWCCCSRESVDILGNDQPQKNIGYFLCICPNVYYLSVSLSLCLYVCLYYSLLTSVNSFSLLCFLLYLPSCWSLLGTISHRGFMYLISMAYLDSLSDNIQRARLDDILTIILVI